MCYVSTLAYVGSENIPFSTKTSLILLMSATFFCKKFVFLAKIIPLLKAIVWMLFWRFFISVFIFCKRLFLKNVSFLNHASGIRLPDGCKLAISKKKRQWRHNLTKWRPRQTLKMLPCFSCYFFSYWFKFHVNIMTSFGVVYKGLIRNPEIGNNPL